MTKNEKKALALIVKNLTKKHDETYDRVKDNLSDQEIMAITAERLAFRYAIDEITYSFPGLNR